MRQKHAKYTKAEVLRIAKCYKHRNDFSEQDRSAYSTASRYGWLDQVCRHMTPKPRGNAGKPNGRRLWTESKCKVEAAKYRYRSEFALGSPSAYVAASSNGWLTQVCKHMTRKPFTPSIRKWTKEVCAQLAIGFTLREDFRRAHPDACEGARRNGYLDEICAHMTPGFVPTSYWTKKTCHQEALKYRTRKSFMLGNEAAYRAARRNKWIDEVCSHMISRSEPLMRSVYVIRRGKKVYVGLSHNPKLRLRMHKTGHGHRKELTKLFGSGTRIWVYGPFNEKRAQELECEKITNYKRRGFRMLNNKPGGSLGGYRNATDGTKGVLRG